MGLFWKDTTFNFGLMLTCCYKIEGSFDPVHMEFTAFFLRSSFTIVDTGVWFGHDQVLPKV